MASALPPIAVQTDASSGSSPAVRPILPAHAGLPWWFVIALAIAVGGAYAPAFRAAFIWDDDAHLTRLALRSWSGLARIWFEPGATQQYYPVLHSLFWLEHRLWGEAAFGYHAVNVLLHLAAALLFTQLLRQLAVPGALLAGALFALHPVHVESVAWISEQKNTLSAAFALFATLGYLRFEADRRPQTYVVALGAFVVAILAKSVVATLPAVLVVLIWMREGRIAWSRVRPLLPWFALAVCAGIATAWIERKIIGAEGVAFALSWLDRTVLAGRVVWFYFGKLLWPQSLAFFYPRWDIDAASPIQWAPMVGLLLVGAIAWRLRSFVRAPLAIALLYLGMLFPVLGFLNVYPFLYSFVADHFQYHASLAAIAGVRALCTRASQKHPLIIRNTAGVAVVGALSVLTWHQCTDYRDAPTLWRATLARNPQSWIAHNNLGKELLGDKAQVEIAIRHFERALALRPAYPEAHNNLGLALSQAGRPLQAIPHLQTSVRLQPRSYQAFNNLGIALAAVGRAADAVTAFERAVALHPQLANLHENLAKALTLAGRLDQAAAERAVAARLRAAAAMPTPPTSPPTPP